MLMLIFAKEGAMLWTSGPLQQQVAPLSTAKNMTLMPKEPADSL